MTFQLDPRLESVLAPVVRRERRLAGWRKLAACWIIAAIVGLLVIALERQTGWASPVAPLVIAAIGLLAALLTLRTGPRTHDWRSLARQIEARYPDLNGRLVTAIQQCSGNDTALTFLQQRIIQEAVLHSRHSDWGSAIAQSRLVFAMAAHWLAVGFLAVVVCALYTPVHGHSLLVRTQDSGISVAPGDVSLERGNSLVVLARFGGALPPNVELVVEQSGQLLRRMPLVKSLADPVFGGSIPDVSSNLDYHVEYAGKRTRDFHVSIFEYPRLERADADLKFPDYTALPPKHIDDTRRISAVEGSRLALAMRFNKPVVSALLVSKDKSSPGIPLSVETNRPGASLNDFALESSKHYELQLLDADGRTNKVPAQFAFDVLTNRAPELRLALPRGDVRLSPLEEVAFEGTVWDDFGVKSYGLGYTIPGKDTKFIELGEAVPAKDKRTFHYLLSLEDLGLGADEVVAWFIWGDDIGPDGNVRRSTSDLFFGEVRPFEEVFREGQGMPGGSDSSQSGQQQGGPAAKQAELQKTIINATWRLQRDHPVRKQPEHKPSDSTGKPPQSSSILPQLPGARPSSGAATGNSMTAAKLIPRHPVFPVSAQTIFGQPAPGDSRAPSPPPRRTLPRSANSTNQPSYQSDVVVVRDAQADALSQTDAASRRQADPRASALWATAKREMEKAITKLDNATNSPGLLPDALAAEQAAYQALLKLQQHEYEVSRSRNRNQNGGGGGGQQLQRQLEQMDLTQSEDRYETQRQAQKPQDNQRREQLQVMNRLQELARRQQDLNDRLKELQTALQEARTEQEREEIRRRLQRLQEEEQQMLADVDELRQRMDQPDNQSRMSDEKRQLDQTREDIQRAAEQAGQGSASQALASGSRAQRQFQQMRDQMRKESSSQFAEDLRQMRADARELARQQDEIMKKMEDEAGNERKSLSDSPDRKDALEQLAKQKERMTNIVERATQVSQQAEEAEPLLSRQLYDTVRKFSQENAKNLQQAQDELINRGIMSRSLYERLKDPSDPEGAKLLDLTSEMLRADFLRQAADSGRRSQSAFNDLKQGVERAAESVIGDDTEALRLAQQQLNQITDQLQREMARAQTENGQTNGITAGGGQREASDTKSLAQAQGTGRRSLEAPSQQTANGSQPANDTREQAAANQGEQSGAGNPQQGQRNAEAQDRNGQQGQGESQPGQSSEQASADGQGGERPQPGGNSGRAGGQRTRAANSGRLSDAAAGGGGDGGDLSGSLGRILDRLAGENTGPLDGPITGRDFGPWSDRLRDVEEMIDVTDLRNSVAVARERARLIRQEVKRDLKKPDWAVVRLEVMKPLLEVRDRIADELARRESTDALVPIDRDPVPTRYSDLVRRYYEELGKEK